MPVAFMNTSALISWRTNFNGTGKFNHGYSSKRGTITYSQNPCSGSGPMTPAALLVCMTIVTNVDTTTVASRACHYEQPATAMVSEPALSTVAEVVVQTPETDVKPMSVADTGVKVKSKKPKYKKHAVRKQRARHRASKIMVQPVSGEEQKTEYRRSWFERLMDM
jgi:hypothetical protein